HIKFAVLDRDQAMRPRDFGIGENDIRRGGPAYAKPERTDDMAPVDRPIGEFETMQTFAGDEIEISGKRNNLGLFRFQQMANFRAERRQTSVGIELSQKDISGTIFRKCNN